MHLKQPVLNARVNAGGDDALDLHALACREVLLITVAIVRGDAPGVPQGGSGLVMHGVPSSRENVAPQELAFSQGLVKLSDQVD